MVEQCKERDHTKGSHDCVVNIDDSMMMVSRSLQF